MRRLGVRSWRWVVFGLALLSVPACSRSHRSIHRAAPAGEKPVLTEATTEQVEQLCGACHKTPPADSFPRSSWRAQVEQGFAFFEAGLISNQPPALHAIQPPTMAQVLAYYEHRAPQELPIIALKPPTTPAPLRFRHRFVPLPPNKHLQAVANVNLVSLSDPHKLDLLACEMNRGRILTLKPHESNPQWRTIARVLNPAHTQVVDLDGDGIKDILVADLGNFMPIDNLCGRVVWLHGKADGTYTPITLLDNVGRVADVRAADFYGRGKLDLIVAVFGWRNTGSIILLENQTTDWNHPRFIPHVLDDRHGTIHVPVCDLNGDGKPDFVALISQEHETVVAFLNEGNGHFRKETIYTAPHPAYGSSGIQLVDLDGDGKLDVLYTNGDTFDDYLPKPYHGIRWLRNRGTFPFEEHLLSPMYGVCRAVAADFQGKGRKDIVAVSMLRPGKYSAQEEKALTATIYLEQVAPGKFVRHVLEKFPCDHVSCVAGAWNGDGKMHFVTGNFGVKPEDHVPPGITLWENLGPSSATSAKSARFRYEATRSKPS